MRGAPSGAVPATEATEEIMQTATAKATPDASPPERNKAVRILAKSLFRELTAQGYNERQIVNLATELISEVTTTIAAKSAKD